MLSCFYPLWPAQPNTLSPNCQYASSLLLKIFFSKKLMINYLFFFFFSNSGHLRKLEFLFLKNKNIKLIILHDSICLSNWLKELNLKEQILFFTLHKISAVPSPATRYPLCPTEWGRDRLPFLSVLSVWILLCFLFMDIPFSLQFSYLLLSHPLVLFADQAEASAPDFLLTPWLRFVRTR